MFPLFNKLTSKTPEVRRFLPVQEHGSTSTSGSVSSCSNPTISNMAPGSVRMANPLMPPVWEQVQSRARVEEQRQESQQEEGKEMWELLLEQEQKEKLKYMMRRAPLGSCIFIFSFFGLFGKSKATSLQNSRRTGQSNLTSLTR